MNKNVTSSMVDENVIDHGEERGYSGGRSKQGQSSHTLGKGADKVVWQVSKEGLIIS
jgi:hypothetical protein